MLKILLVLIICGMCRARTSKDLRVRTEDGRVIGRYMTSVSGRTIRAFMGIPYAEPPVDDLRFRPPVNKKIYMGVLMAHEEPPMCLQADPFARSRKLQGQEDCLYLNVYAPEIRNASEKVPVMVFFHGGGWMTGHGGYSLYPPEYLLEHDVVLVTGNYRLGPLGFLSYEDKELPGNFGLKDQVMLMTWVKMNIEKFGGDSTSVTIFGQSAGGASVNYHMISPMSKGLFERGISHSGTIMNNWSDPPRKGLAKMRAIRLTDKVGCPIANTNYKKMADCLRKADSRSITEALFDFFEWDFDPVIPFPPVIENSYDSEDEAFLPSFRYSKHSFDIPWMLGFTSEEGLIKLAAFYNNPKLMNEMINNWDLSMPITFNYDHLYEEEQKQITAELKEFYFDNELLLDEKRDNLTQLHSHGFFVGLFDNLEYRIRDNLRDNTFFYQFSHKGYASYTELYVGGEKFYGTSHADDLLYLFPCHKTIPELLSSIPSDEDKQVTRLMTKLWVNFATTGNPTPEWSTASELPLWTPARKFPVDTMMIGNRNGNSEKLLSLEKYSLPDGIKLWQKLRSGMPKWTSGNIKDETQTKEEL